MNANSHVSLSISFDELKILVLKPAAERNNYCTATIEEYHDRANAISHLSRNNCNIKVADDIVTLFSDIAIRTEKL